MRLLAGGCRVYSREDGDISREGSRTTRAVVSPASGSKRISQSVAEYSSGASPTVANPGAEEVLYVATGKGNCVIDGARLELRPGAAVYIPPDTSYRIENPGPDQMQVISSCCPLIGTKTGSATGTPAMVHEDDREQIRAGQDRIFRYLVHTDTGCRQVTQFVGWIPESKAPFHWHAYEEVIYILEGQGALHLEEQPAAAEFSPGSSIYLPDHVVHCLENPGPAPIRILGVFYPSGSPGEAYEDA